MDNHIIRLLTEREKPIRVGIVGSGRFSRGLFHQIRAMRGIEIAAASDPIPSYAEEAFKSAGYSDLDIARASSAVRARELIEQGRRVVLDDPLLMSEAGVDVVVDATGVPALGAELAYRSLEQGVHVVMVNVEADVAIGPLLRRKAESAGVVYTLADGDQPSLAKGLFNWAETLGLKATMLGKWTGVYSESEAESIIREGKKTLRMSDLAYLDGSKNQIEMACIANMTGFAPDVPGMHAPRASLDDIPNVFAPVASGGILRSGRIVDVINCRNENGVIQDKNLRGGVFMVVTSDNPGVLDILNDKGILMSRDGRRGIIYRTHHLLGVEAPYSIVKAALLGEGTGCPQREFSAEVVAVAKRDLRAGERLDWIGGMTVRGVIYPHAEAERRGYVPQAMADGVYTGMDIAKGTILTSSMLREPGSDFLWRLRGTSI